MVMIFLEALPALIGGLVILYDIHQLTYRMIQLTFIFVRRVFSPINIT